MNRLKTTYLPLVTLFACVVPFSFAQNAEEEAIVMDRFEVRDVPVEENIIPTSRQLRKRS